MTQKTLLLGLVSLAFSLVVSAQQNMTLYQMHDILQSNTLNPSVVSDCRWNVGFPVLGNVSVAASAPVSYNSLGAGKEFIDGPKVVSLLKDNNLISSNENIALIMLGYRTETMYLQFNINERVSLASAFAKPPFEILLLGNSQFAGQTVSGTFDFAAMHYREYALSAAFGLGENTWLGLRGKLMFGRIGALGHNTISLTTDLSTYAMSVVSDFDSKVSMPGEVEINPASGTTKKFKHNLSVNHFVFNPSNIGGGLDLGFNTTLENGLKVSASILNLGMINWTKDVHEFTLNNTVNYSGSTNINSWDDFIDTLKSIYRPYHANIDKYSQWLSPAVMAGANYPVHDYFRAGITGYGEFTPAGVPWAISALLLTQDVPYVQGALSYTVTNNSFVNIGLGAGLNLGVFNIHAMTDNIIGLFSPYSQKYATFQFGINFKFGCDGDFGGDSKKYKSIPCPSHGGGSAKSYRAVPCPK
ncbi:MAG: DUF5723 family protein [Prevotellaceae bacterium]|jgi:hypothetical protein|nr:DUF5723 family protein [Prevotellaceae bacterium]